MQKRPWWFPLLCSWIDGHGQECQAQVYGRAVLADGDFDYCRQHLAEALRIARGETVKEHPA